MTPPTNDLLTKSYLLMVIAACITIGAVGLLGPLAIPDPGPLGLPLARESGLAALLAGTGLIAHLQQWRGLKYASGLLLLLLVGFSLAQHGTDLPGMLDEPTRDRRDHLSIEAALLLIAIAICLMIPGSSRLALRPWRWVGSLMLFLGTLSALWMLLDQAPWLRFQSSGAWVAVLFTLLFGGAMLLASRLRHPRLDDLGGWAIAAAVLGSLASALAWYQLSLAHNRDLQEIGEAQIDRIEAVTEQVLTDRVLTLNRLAERWSLLEGSPRFAAFREHDAQSYLRDLDNLQSMAIVNNTLATSWLTSRGPTGQQMIRRLLAEPALQDWLRSSFNQPRLRLLPDMPSAGRASALVALPMGSTGRPDRQLLALLDFNGMLDDALRPATAPISAHLWLEDKLVSDLFSGPRHHEDQAKLAERGLSLPYGPLLRVTSYLEAKLQPAVASLLPSGVALIGLSVTQLVILLLAFSRSSLRQTRRLTMIRQELESQQTIQQMILHGDSLQHTLDSVCELIEDHYPGSHCSIMLSDPSRQYLHLASAPSLTAAFRAAMTLIPISDVGTCGTSAYRKDAVFTEDIAADPRWTGFQELAQQNGLRSCWSYPLLSSEGEALGTFASYREVPGTPSASQRRQIALAADLVSLAVERHADQVALEENEQRYRSLFSHNPDAVFSLDDQGRLQSFNHATEAMYDRSSDDLSGKSAIELIDAEDRGQVEHAIKRAMGGRTQAIEFSVNHADGSRHEFDVTFLPVVINGRIDGVYALAKDITVRKRQERRLRTLERSVEASIHGVVITDARQPDHPIIYTNAAFTRISGYSADEIIGRNCRFLQGKDTDPEAIAEIRDGVARREPVRVLLRNYRKDGKPFWNELHVSPVEDDSGEVTHFVGLQNDVSEYKSYEASLAYHATHDTLTGLTNRAMFEDRLSHMVEISRRRRTRVAVLFIDLDEFKPINDSLGHAVGDKILIEVARRLEHEMRAEDTLARFGGDEFVALLADIQTEEDALLAAERLLPTVSRPYRVDEHELYLSASIGITISEPDTDQPLSLIQQADMAMYRAKQQGRNTCQIFNEEINTQVRRRVGLRNDLQEAIERQDFEVFYQPLVEASGGRVAGLEALLRWNHPEHGWISPATFIPLAEDTGQIIPLSEWILERACRDMQTLRANGLEDGRVAINLSPLQFNRPNFLATIRRTLDVTGLPAKRLELELTEGILMDEGAKAIETLRNLQDSSISVSIDDFGTGFSSLSYLKHLPIDKIKIDRSFIMGVETSGDDAAIIQGIISMAHHLGIKVVAEGIETEAQRALLAGWGCDILQGYFFARPMPLSKLSEWLQHGRQAVQPPD
ncbi:EAL domain-containing protein [Guyparkeria sp. 1SP6A2]|nr:EAL domain-containing protein [Guyparkeria sp. 1SP6A2]